MVGRRRFTRTGSQAGQRREQTAAGLRRALEWAQARLSAISPDDYADERLFKQVRTARLKSVRRLERILLAFADVR